MNIIDPIVSSLPRLFAAALWLVVAQALFRRTLSNWVGDLLVLRQTGMLEMTWHAAGDELPAYRAAA